MKIEYCEFRTKKKELAETRARTLNQEWIQKYTVLYEEWIWHYIITKVENVKFFKTKEIELSDDQLAFNF